MLFPPLQNLIIGYAIRLAVSREDGLVEFLIHWVELGMAGVVEIGQGALILVCIAQAIGAPLAVVHLDQLFRGLVNGWRAGLRETF